MNSSFYRNSQSQEEKKKKYNLKGAIKALENDRHLKDVIQKELVSLAFVVCQKNEIKLNTCITECTF